MLNSHLLTDTTPVMSLIPATQNGLMRLVPLPRLSQGGRWRTEAMRSYRMPVLYWFTQGQGRITVAGTTRGYGAHNAVFVPAGVMHGFEMTGKSFGTAIFFDAPDIAELPEEARHLRVRSVTDQGEFTTILENLNREIEGDAPYRERALRHHCGLLAVWLDRQFGEGEAQSRSESSAEILAETFTHMVEERLFTGQSVSDYAEALGVTPTHLSRVCRETCGRPASAILQDRVIYEARRLLFETSMPVKQIAEVLGYNSAAYFSRAFQKRTGQSPSDFRAEGARAPSLLS